MLKKKYLFWTAIAAVICAVALASATDHQASSPPSVSGRLVDGFRLLTVEEGREPLHFKVYRGDYVKFAFDPSLGEPVLAIPALSIRDRLSADADRRHYFKMKASGVYAFTLGPVSGRIEVVDYREAHYREVSSQEAARMIETRQPLILDVRTPREFAQGHLEKAQLIPVQDIARRLHEIAAYKDRDILIYCATGNRSTVASKILNDNGFQRVANLRHGIVQWARDQQPVVR
jgi:rhodanese-related sulfurtransferase